MINNWEGYFYCSINMALPSLGLTCNLLLFIKLTKVVCYMGGGYLFYNYFCTHPTFIFNFKKYFKTFLVSPPCRTYSTYCPSQVDVTKDLSSVCRTLL